MVFGRVVGGAQFVTEVENQKVDASHRPYADVRITHCGELVLLKKSEFETKDQIMSCRRHHNGEHCELCDSL